MAVKHWRTSTHTSSWLLTLFRGSDSGDLLRISSRLIDLVSARNRLAARFELKIFQSNAEGEIVSIIGDHIDWAAGILINPAAYTHTSVAIRDALSAVNLPVIEIHLSNTYAREPFRHRSYVSPVAVGVIGGFGAYSYDLALDAMIHILRRSE